MIQFPPNKPPDRQRHYIGTLHDRNDLKENCRNFTKILTKRGFMRAGTTAHIYRYLVVAKVEAGNKNEPIFQNISATKHLRATTFP